MIVFLIFCLFMQYTLPLKYILKNFSLFFIFSENFYKNTLIIYTSSFLSFFLTFFVKYSIFFKDFSLFDIGSYEIPIIDNFNRSRRRIFNILYKNIIWYLYRSSVFSNYLFLFSLVVKSSIKSIETIYKNAKWLEREISDFFNIFFINKVDRRSLFSIPMFYESPYKKKYPMTGFYEIFICFFTKKIKFKHVSFKI